MKIIQFNCYASTKAFLRATKANSKEFSFIGQGSILTDSVSIIECAKNSPYVYDVI